MNICQILIYVGGLTDESSVDSAGYATEEFFRGSRKSGKRFPAERIALAEEYNAWDAF
jgi:hypothetical protein